VRLATPANWRQCDDVIITGAVSKKEVDKSFPGYKMVNNAFAICPFS
jgi:hypothetical protein